MILLVVVIVLKPILFEFLKIIIILLYFTLNILESNLNKVY